MNEDGSRSDKKMPCAEVPVMAIVKAWREMGMSDGGRGRQRDRPTRLTPPPSMTMRCTETSRTRSEEERCLQAEVERDGRCSASAESESVLGHAPQC